MLVFALVASVRTRPKPTIFTIFDSLNKELAHFIRCRLLITLLRKHDRLQLLFVPVCRSFHLLRLLFVVSGIGIQILLLSLAFHIKIVREFTLLSLLAMSLLVKLT